MSWLRLDDQYPEHPKLACIPTPARWAHVRCMAYCARHLTDGFIPEEVAREYAGEHLPTLTKKPRIGEPLLVSCEGGYEVHDYLDYNPTREKVLADKKRNAERVARHRNADGNGDCNGVTNSISTDVPSPSLDLDPKPVTPRAGTRAMRATLPACLSIPSHFTDFPGVTLGQAILQHADDTFRWNGGCAPDRSGLITIFEAGCLEGCSKSEAQVQECAGAAIKAIDKCATKGLHAWPRARALFDRIVTEDRERKGEAS